MFRSVHSLAYCTTVRFPPCLPAPTLFLFVWQEFLLMETYLNLVDNAVGWLALEAVLFTISILILIEELHHVRNSLPPAGGTRLGKAQRRKNTAVFISLAIVSLGLVGFFKSYHLFRSYQEWTEHDDTHMVKEPLREMPNR